MADDPACADELATDDVPEGVDPPTLDQLATAGDASADRG